MPPSPSPLQRRHRPFRNNAISRQEIPCCGLVHKGNVIWRHEKPCRSLQYMATMLSRENKNIRRSRSVTTICSKTKKSLTFSYSDNVVPRHKSPCRSLVHRGSTVHPIRRLGAKSFPRPKRFRLARHSKYRPPDPNKHYRRRQETRRQPLKLWAPCNANTLIEHDRKGSLSSVEYPVRRHKSNPKKHAVPASVGCHVL